MSRAILADAISLVRGDRHLTTDFTPHSTSSLFSIVIVDNHLTPLIDYTAWGMTECSRDPNNAGRGGYLGKLLARHLPNHYNDSSIYTHFPLMQPDDMTKFLRDKNRVNDFSLDQPKALTPIQSFPGTKFIYEALRSPRTETFYLQNVKDIFPGYTGFLTTLDDPVRNQAATLAIQEIFVPATSLQGLGQWFFNKTTQLVKEKSYKVVDKRRSVDIVRDVFRLVPVHWSATEVVRTSRP